MAKSGSQIAPLRTPPSPSARCAQEIVRTPHPRSQGEPKRHLHYLDVRSHAYSSLRTWESCAPNEEVGNTLIRG
ncbi:hypothetical protein B0T16DRAFT_61643 [Cercophora newfieldiana]|uniref:Uncharacterized protein n=1 Tax=Cercophora newfieldiana TaxID=92897 RepID=A0AA40CZR9_9PEZI|nr:hypothetical protein B0T16DRAFT_61643 [Cercophora newfieldiana]